MRPLKPPVRTGEGRPATNPSATKTQPGARPPATRKPAIAATSTIGLARNAARRCGVRSSQAPTTGPVTTVGKVAAATVQPATCALPVSARTNSTTATEYISVANRPAVAPTQSRAKPRCRRSRERVRSPSRLRSSLTTTSEAAMAPIVTYFRTAFGPPFGRSRRWRSVGRALPGDQGLDGQGQHVDEVVVDGIGDEQRA